MISYPTIQEKHSWQVRGTSEIKKIISFLDYTPHGMNFHSCEKQIFKSFSCTKICNKSKWTKTSRGEVMQPTIRNSDSRPVFSYDVHSQPCFDIPFINGRSFIYFGISKMNFIFEILTKVQGSVSIKPPRLQLSMFGQHQDILL